MVMAPKGPTAQTKCGSVIAQVSRSDPNHVIWLLENRQMLTASGVVASRKWVGQSGSRLWRRAMAKTSQGQCTWVRVKLALLHLQQQ